MSIATGSASSSFSPAERDELMDDAEHLNADYPDTVLFVARVLGGRDDAQEAEISDIGPAGASFRLRLEDGGWDGGFVHFAEHPASLEAAREALHGLVAEARSRVGEALPLTSVEREIAAAGTRSTFPATVVEVAELTPGLREITFGGLGGFEPLGPDQFLLVTLPESKPDDPARAYYTVRRWRPEVGQMDMWFVLHDHGPIGSWASTAAPGDEVTLWGPRSFFSPARESDSLLLVADETGLAAVASVLDTLGSTMPARVIVETSDRHHVVDLGDHPVEWLFRGSEPPGSGRRLLGAVQALDDDLAGVHAFGAAESRQITAVRKHLRYERGMPQANVQMTGYWRRQASV